MEEQEPQLPPNLVNSAQTIQAISTTTTPDTPPQRKSLLMFLASGAKRADFIIAVLTGLLIGFYSLFLQHSVYKTYLNVMLGGIYDQLWPNLKLGFFGIPVIIVYFIDILLSMPLKFTGYFFLYIFPVLTNQFAIIFEYFLASYVYLRFINRKSSGNKLIKKYLPLMLLFIVLSFFVIIRPTNKQASAICNDRVAYSHDSSTCVNQLMLSGSLDKVGNEEFYNTCIKSELSLQTANLHCPNQLLERIDYKDPKTVAGICPIIKGDPAPTPTLNGPPPSSLTPITGNQYCVMAAIDNWSNDLRSHGIEITDQEISPMIQFCDGLLAYLDSDAVRVCKNVAHNLNYDYNSRQ